MEKMFFDHIDGITGTIDKAIFTACTNIGINVCFFSVFLSCFSYERTISIEIQDCAFWTDIETITAFNTK
jgi:hypothetical protein